MANHASAAKRNRQRITRTARNRAIKARVRTALKAARVAVGTAEGIEQIRSAQSLLDRAASKNAIPKKRASRLKGRLAKALNKAGKAA